MFNARRRAAGGHGPGAAAGSASPRGRPGGWGRTELGPGGCSAPEPLPAAGEGRPPGAGSASEQAASDKGARGKLRLSHPEVIANCASLGRAGAGYAPAPAAARPDLGLSRERPVHFLAAILRCCGCPASGHPSWLPAPAPRPRGRGRAGLAVGRSPRQDRRSSRAAESLERSSRDQSR